MGQKYLHVIICLFKRGRSPLNAPLCIYKTDASFEHFNGFPPEGLGLVQCYVEPRGI